MEMKWQGGGGGFTNSGYQQYSGVLLIQVKKPPSY